MKCTRFVLLALLATLLATTAVVRGQIHKPIPKIAVTTYHYDNFRSGWNSHEEILNPTLRPPGPVAIDHFALIHRVSVDDTVFAQPLIAPDVTIAGTKHDVAYVVTENNTVYAIDADSGKILLSRNLGAAVPRPAGCANNGPEVGIESTPVIDTTHQAMYLMSYTLSGGQPTYLLHAIDITTLADQAKPVAVSASHGLSDGSTFHFSAADQRQRAALLFEDGNVYAAFASWCDTTPARGWLLGWRAPDLQPLSANILTNRLPASKSKLASIWMSGYGVAAVAGHLYFVTGNAPGNTFDKNNNLSESVVKVTADLTQILDYFTPSDVTGLDGADVDFGSGGAMLLPDQPGSVTHLAVAAGKAGWMYLLDRNNMGEFSPLNDNVVGQYPVGACWCGQSYYLNNIVSSGGSQVGVWQIYTEPTTGLTQIYAGNIATGGDGGFFTAISSNGSQNVLIWAVSRRHSKDGGPEPTLYAFEPVPGNPQLKQVFMAQAGNWDVPHPPGDGSNSNIVPVVANGHVYVASYKELDIFGFAPPEIEAAVPPAEHVSPLEAPRHDSAGGAITKIEGERLTVKTNDGAEIVIDVTKAVREGLAPALHVGDTISAYGSTDSQGVFHAEVIRGTHKPAKPKR